MSSTPFYTPMFRLGTGVTGSGADQGGWGGGGGGGGVLGLQPTQMLTVPTYNKATVCWKRVSGHPPAYSLEGHVIWPLLSLLCTAHAQYNYHGLSKHPIFDMYRKCLNCTGNVEVK